jgi:cyclopropane fatty-acyl-phospholipid synthase-like methyltransferase
MKEFWNARYSAKEYAYGELPNEYLVDKLSALDAGKILFAADGEGRNGVFAAKLGWDVTSFDISESGKMKAEKLAEKNKVNIKYDIADLESIQYPIEKFNAIGLIYAHFHKNKRRSYHQKLDRLLQPGGYLILEAFSKNHIDYNRINDKVGGPKDVDMLYSIDEIQHDFPNYTILELKETELILNEGEFHRGKGSVIRFFGRKN